MPTTLTTLFANSNLVFLDPLEYGHKKMDWCMGFLMFSRFSSLRKVMSDQCWRSCCTLSDGKGNNNNNIKREIDTSLFRFPEDFFFRGMLLSGQRWSSCYTLSDVKRNSVNGGLERKLLRGTYSKKDLWYPQKPIYLPIFTSNIWSYLLWSPVIIEPHCSRSPVASETVKSRVSIISHRITVLCYGGT